MDEYSVECGAWRRGTDHNRAPSPARRSVTRREYRRSRWPRPQSSHLLTLILLYESVTGVSCLSEPEAAGPRSFTETFSGQITYSFIPSSIPSFLHHLANVIHPAADNLFCRFGRHCTPSRKAWLCLTRAACCSVGRSAHSDWSYPSSKRTIHNIKARGKRKENRIYY